jgi:hypothetical protein
MLELGCGNVVILKKILKKKKFLSYLVTYFVKELIDNCKFNSKSINANEQFAFAG